MTKCYYTCDLYYICDQLLHLCLQHCLRFLWLATPPDLSKIVVYRFCRVVFGLNASRFLLNATLRHHISKFMAVDPEFVKKLIDSFYVDDFVGGGASSSEVVDLYSKTVNRMADGAFKLRKWLTNDPSVREKINKHLIDDVKLDPVSAENVTYAKSSLGLKMGSNGQKVLGLSWNFEQDLQ